AVAGDRRIPHRAAPARGTTHQAPCGVPAPARPAVAACGPGVAARIRHGPPGRSVLCSLPAARACRSTLRGAHGPDLPHPARSPARSTGGVP
ncbi:hypothetical protein, partial [Streptomyces plumbiresistens]|uniref:hypothetical protein n=1 Tax=Streptomyces plumbiresistens TaxID=511811 RepID=UPI0031EA9ECE